VLTVKDTGTGIPSAELPHFFERFHRGIALLEGPDHVFAIANTVYYSLSAAKCCPDMAIQRVGRPWNTTMTSRTFASWRKVHFEGRFDDRGVLESGRDSTRDRELVRKRHQVRRALSTDGHIAGSCSVSSPLSYFGWSRFAMRTKSSARHTTCIFKFERFMAAVLRAIIGYCFLILVVRVDGRRPGKQLAPFEFVLIFFIGGLALTAIAGDERSRVDPEDVMAAARTKSVSSVFDIKYAVLERNGTISIIKNERRRR
jgi:hypothetical protein